ITLLSEGGPSATVLDGEREGTVLYANDVGAATIIEGFTIARGESSGDYPDIFGGGILCSASSPAFRDCVITGNVADHGGGLYCINGSAPSFLNCTFMSNEALYRGGGIFISSSEPTFENCIITGNRGESGGGIYTTYDASVFLGCTISGNEATYRGGGFYCFLTSTPVELERVILRGNCAAVGGQDAQLKWSGFSLTCNALRWDGIEGTNHQLIVNSLQVVEDPLFCEPEPCDEAPTPLGNYTLAGSSPCLPESSPCGRLIGALGAGCTIPSPTLSISWGRLKLGR
ncbi:MAG: right-handed parallel beta-helix repeat-containing protein, partial [Candidatus Eisenbacteria bacterium]|nr:right-handed parallel beta-helix repeat-containing protein [Candidatus Eisenbacteria bacterium]